MEIQAARSSGEGLPEEYRPHFVGEADMQPLTTPFNDGPAMFVLHFHAGARTRPHVHRRGQILHVVSGEGVVADAEGRRIIRPGETVTVLPDEWHWHGALANSPMAHLTVQHTGADVVWDVDERDWADGYDPLGSAQEA